MKEKVDSHFFQSMISLSPEEKEAVFNWGKNELVKSLKSEAAFCIFNEIINGGEFDINALSRKLAFKLGTKNGQFIAKLQKYIKTLQNPNVAEEQNKENNKNNDNDLTQGHQLISPEPNTMGVKTISKTILPSDNNENQGTVIFSVKFDTPPKDANNDDAKDKDEDEEEDEKEEEEEGNAPPDPNQDFLAAQRRFLIAREEARMNQKIEYTPKVSFQPKLWSNLFHKEIKIEKKHEEEEDHVDMKYVRSILIDDETPDLTTTKEPPKRNINRVSSSSSSSSSSYSDYSYSDSESSPVRTRRHHRRHRRRH